MAYTNASNKAVQKYSAKNYDQIKILVKKGERETIKAAATAAGESTNAYIISAIDSRMKSEGLAGLPQKTKTDETAPEDEVKPAQNANVKTKGYMIEALNRQMREGIGIKDDDKTVPETEDSSANTEPVSRLPGARKPKRRSN